MKIDKVHLITFSPTHTSKQVGEAIVQGLTPENLLVQDITLPTGELQPVETGALTVITVPVYGGKVAPLAMTRLEALQGAGSFAVLVAVYGNRAYEKALQELDAKVSQCGFKVIAAATFVGEHSYSTADTPIAVGRPDADDLAFATDFGKKIAQKVSDAADEEHLYGVDVLRIPRPKQPIWPMLKFVRQVLKWKKQGTPLPRTPQTDADLCKHCGLCVKSCPNAAIVAGDECNTVAERCIRCCACVKFCPHKARTYNTPFAPLLSNNFKKRKENKILL